MDAGGTFRVLDTGVLEGRLNIAIGQAIVEARQAGRVPDTLRFLRFPPTALVGRHQALGQEVNLEYCAAHGIGVVRRITGGGAIFMEPGLLGWELAFDRNTLGVASLPELTRTICEAAAAGISSLGVQARYRPRNDIEVDGRKISGTGGFFDGGTLFYQGTVLVDMDPGVMVAALRVPQAKLARRQLDSAAQRVVTLRELLGDETPELPVIQDALAGAFARRFGLQVERGRLSDAELEEAQARYREETISSRGFAVPTWMTCGMSYEHFSSRRRRRCCRFRRTTSSRRSKTRWKTHEPAQRRTTYLCRLPGPDRGPPRGAPHPVPILPPVHGTGIGAGTG
jgi:lipoate-protein ligase A